MAQDEMHRVSNNDIIVMATDGVWDNCFDTEIMSIVKEGIQNGNNLDDPQSIALAVAKLASKHGHDSSYRSPFEVSSEEAHDSKTRPGGKLDDIAVIVSQIKL